MHLTSLDAHYMFLTAHAPSVSAEHGYVSLERISCDVADIFRSVHKSSLRPEGISLDFPLFLKYNIIA
jgi:hypothetical protein